MIATYSSPRESFWREDPFGIFKPEDLRELGIDPSDIPQGTLAAKRHPPLLSSRFGGNAYGIGFFEMYDHLDPEDIQFLQSVAFEDPDQVKRYYKRINRIYRRIGLLIRFSSQGKPYYLIPTYLVSTSITNIKNKSDEISKIIHFHRKKYLKESHKIGMITNTSDPIVNDLTIRFKEHQFIIIDSPEKLVSIKEILDLVILPRDIFRTVLLEKLSRNPGETLSLKQLEKHALHMLGKIYGILKPEGEIFVIANQMPLKTNRTAQVTFKTTEEQKNFLIFSHIFKTRKKYRITDGSIRINLFDLKRYLGVLYIEQDVIDELFRGKDPEEMTVEEANTLPYLNLPLDNEFTYDQNKVWPRLLSIYFNKIFHKSLTPDSIKTEWKQRFSIRDESVDYFLIHLAQKKSIDATFTQLKSDILESKLPGCPLNLLADYRNSFDFLIRTLNVLNNIKTDRYKGLPEIYMERLSEPIENRKRRYSGLNDVLKLMNKVHTLERIQTYINPDMSEGTETAVLENLDILPFFGFSYGELREIFLIIVGHTAMGRILSGKMNEKALKPVSDLARRFEHHEALNLLRYCRLMSMAESVASRRTDMNRQQLTELFDLFESMVRVVTNRDMDWDSLLDEKIAAMGGIHNKLIHKLLMMMNHFEFLHNWPELPHKGEMEKESLADYDDEKIARIENIIGLIKIIEIFENKFLKDNPLQLPIIYRKFLNMEFHGTGHIFERMDAQLVFILLWLTVNVTRGEIINFNPIVADIAYSDIDAYVKKVEQEARAINRDYLDLNTLHRFGEQLYQNQSAYIMNTGFQISLDPGTQAVNVSYIDMDENIRQLEDLAGRFAGCKIAEIPIEDLEELERLFSNLEGFYRGHLSYVASSDSESNLPERQKNWFRKAQAIRRYLKSNLLNTIFEPDNVYTDLDRLFHHARSILHFALPEFPALQEVSLSGKIYLRSPLFKHMLVSTKKMQALIRGDLKDFQDKRTLHKLAQREFGPLAAGTVGFNDSQLETLKAVTGRIRRNPSLFNALIKAFIFQDLGLTPGLREKYQDKINQADQAQAGALFLKMEKIPERYHMDKQSERALLFLIEHHDWIHHLIRGEYSLHALKEITDLRDMELFNAFFISSFIMFSALGEDLILEDLATYLFEIKDLCTRMIRGETTFDHYFKELYSRKGHMFYALEEYEREGLPEGLTPTAYINTWKRKDLPEERRIQYGSMVYSVERIFRLRGIRYVDFYDLANLILKVPLKYIFQKKNYYSVGYATFEKDLFEALRIYNGMKRLPEMTRDFILNRLAGDRIRIFGFENVSIYLNYENQIKLLLIALLGSQKLKSAEGPVCLNFLPMVEKIDKRYEVINDLLSGYSVARIWGNRNQVNQFFKAKTGLLLDKDDRHGVLEIDFVDRVNISRKISHMDSIADVDQLKNYYHYSLQSLRKSPFYTDDYEIELEEAFYKRLSEITDHMLEQVKGQMELLHDFKELHHLYVDFTDRSLEIGFSEDQNHRLTDLYELRKDTLRRKKLEEIIDLLEKIHDMNELKDYWEGIKWYLLNNRPFIGKEFETMIANHFDRTVQKIKDMSFQVHFMS